MDCHLMYNDLMNKTNAIFAEDDHIRNIIMLLYRDDYYRRVDVQDDQKAEVIIAKHPLATDLPLTIEMTYNAVAGGFMNRGHTHK